MQDSLVNYLIPNLAIASLEFLLVGFLVVCLLAIRPGTSPLWRRRIWLLAMLKPFATVVTGFFPGLIHLPSFLTAGNFLGDLLSPHVAGDSLLADGGSGAVFLKVVAYLWLFGTGVMLYILWRRAIVSNQMIEDAADRGYILKPSSVKVLDPTLDVSPNARIIITPDESGPATLGAWRSVVVIPENLLPWVNEHRDPTQLERDRFLQVLRHELSHLARRDDLATMLAAITVAFFWFHPIAHWAYSRVRINNELCCDMQVVESGVLPSDYVNTLMNVVSGQFARKGFSMGILGDASSAGVLRRRLHFLLSDEVEKSAADRSKWGYFMVAIMLFTLPRLIAPTQSTVEVFDASGQIVRVTIEELSQNPGVFQIVEPGQTHRLVGSDAQFAQGAVGGEADEGVNGQAIPANELAMGDIESDAPPAADPANDADSLGGDMPEDGEMLANASDDDREIEDKTEEAPSKPRQSSGGRPWSVGGLSEPTPPDTPILPTP
ncbi:MAG TPA: M56 family metallopeptidase [Phycisphaerae bacterium]|nr:M56 family metallopeptidase [Phycisphaerae bacterium]